MQGPWQTLRSVSCPNMIRVRGRRQVSKKPLKGRQPFAAAVGIAVRLWRNPIAPVTRWQAPLVGEGRYEYHPFP